MFFSKRRFSACIFLILGFAMHLLISSAGDVTSDLLCQHLSGSVLRINWERWDKYDLDIDASAFRIADQFGRVVTTANLENIIWRKPLAEVDISPGEFWYCFHEFKYGIEYIIDYVRQTFPIRLPIDPHHNRTVTKFKQLIVAKKYLYVPSWRFTCDPSRQQWGGKWIAKSLTGQPIPGTGVYSKVIYTTSICPSDLADRFPWFLQEEYDATCDLTVVFVDGKQFGFLLDRSLFPGLDWRKSIGNEHVDNAWTQVAIPPLLQGAITSIMRDLHLRFGRLDLLAKTPDCKEVVFLEVNPNGQWAWLDLKQTNGLFDAVLDLLSGNLSDIKEAWS